MSPIFLPGEYVILWRPLLTPYREGDSVVFRHPRYGVMIKHILSIQGDYFFASGVSDESISHSDIGLVPLSSIIGKVIYHIR